MIEAEKMNHYKETNSTIGEQYETTEFHRGVLCDLPQNIVQ